MNNPTEKRLNKFISDSGFCSRREADKLIEQNRVTINGKHPELGTKVQTNDIVEVDGKAINSVAEDKTDRVYIAYNKPVGITCTTERHVHGNIIDAIKHRERIFPIGRLDKPSEGLIFLTSDGDIVNKILRAENAHDKEYIVHVDQPISERFIKRMSQGIPILGTVTKPCKVTMVSKFVFTIILTQGLNRQIRRMCEYLDYEVTSLKRSRIMNVTLDGLKPGQWRNLTEQEMDEINQAVAGSKSTTDRTVSETKKSKINQEVQQQEITQRVLDQAKNTKKKVLKLPTKVKSTQQDDNSESKKSKPKRKKFNTSQRSYNR
ncbi:23S rRNA pseudouridine(2604) synthase RluF [Vibrio sp. SS-MA-C1-2]|uniref:23S rRNA pseudouridine(2604) synthase RluF n=1 Tax=Vibrio sp. SS-MA-C1-2 TaxID=2908646 RepID=UPI001F2700B7|nr:23S rRNA pseudouridine(2604) synthase RluF [Vibrio sp. SS-MA-C1-2]UJF16827.1 23S rRNA pseudouridine(2604) synthase RluF [Vibrio sp. SS-MA-C1-2]